VGGALTETIEVVIVVVVLLVLAAAALAARRFLLERGGGTIECGLRSPAGTGAWRLGLASYQRDELHWYGALGLLPRATESFPRRSIEVASRREPDAAEARVLGPQRVIVELRGARHAELAMSSQALTGFLAWLEASPPGSHLQDIALIFPERPLVTPDPSLSAALPAPAPAPAASGRRPGATGRRHGRRWRRGRG